ncbi:MAG: hypothetical protein QXZ70_01735 [Candidatus Bathyarchaeia archaeon]
MPTVSKNPSQTEVIVSGWNNPTNAYAEDGANTDASPPDNSTYPEQKYTGFGFTESDIPPGSTITKVEMGAKHYETDPTGKIASTSLKYRKASGSSIQVTLTKRSSLTWDWYDITSQESSWNLSMLQNADVRIIASTADAGGGGCYVETDNEKTYVIVKLPDNTYTLKSCSELAVGDLILIWEWKKGLMFSPVERIEASDLIQEDVVEVWSGQVNLKPVINKDVVWKSHVTLTKLQKLPLYKKAGNKYVGPMLITAEELHQRLMMGEEFYLGHLWYKWTIEMMPVDMAAMKTVNGKAYKIVTADKNSNIINKSLMKHELESLNNHGLTLKRQAEVGPPFMGVSMKTTSYVDTLALRVTYSTPIDQRYNVGEGMTNQIALI